MMLFSSSNFAQVIVEGNLNTRQESNVLISCFCGDSHQLIPVGLGGRYIAKLPRFEECLLVFYAINAHPTIVNFNTDQVSTEKIELNIELEGGKPAKDKRVTAGPKQRISTNDASYTSSKFSLDDIKDKPKFAALMATMYKDINNFYMHNTLPPERLTYTSTVSESKVRKSEHKLGEEIYVLLMKKRVLEKKVKEKKGAYENQNLFEEYAACNFGLELLKKEASLAKTNFELAEKEFQKEKLINRRKENAGSRANVKAVQDAERIIKKNKRLYEIALLNMKNKQADCWELRLQAKVDLELTKGENADKDELEIRKLEIDNVRMRKRLENAILLYREHNSLANDLTGRDRVVQLANAQKYISEKAQIKLYQSENELAKWKIKAKKDPAALRQLNMANDEFLLQREFAFQAEMAYLEHMWHLRDIPKVKDVLDDLFTRQNGLLAIVPIDRPEPIEEQELSENRSDAELLSNVKIESSTTELGRKKRLTFKEDFYEIFVDKNGTRTYRKNGKAITSLTYEFETKRKFGELLENVVEPERKKKLWGLFKKRIQ